MGEKNGFTHHHSIFGIYIYWTVHMFTFSNSEKNSQNFHENQKVKGLYYPPWVFGARFSRYFGRKRKQMLWKKVSYNLCPIIEDDLQKNVIYQLLGTENPMSLVSEMLKYKSLFSFVDTYCKPSFKTQSPPIEPQCHLWGMQNLKTVFLLILF